ncbi:MAG: phosphodiester glycosidase family protein, partial [Anaerolineales bacterium]|nr:phosphodiester glycosidase family protein [Anaerolineales bacterium]
MQKSFFLIILTLILVPLACQLPSTSPSPTASPSKGAPLFPGVTYTRDVRTSPRPLVIHIVEIDLRTEGISAFVTPGDPTRELPLDARTTSAFLEEFNLQIAINGDGFTPWTSNPLAPYPKPNDPVAPLGLAISNGILYSPSFENLPTLYFSPNGKATINDPPGNIAHAISGLEMLLQSGKILPGLDGDPEPRTAIGLNRAGKILILLLVDGRQPGYSEGVTLPELAALLLEYGAHDGMNMDGGGSSTLVIEGEN